MVFTLKELQKRGCGMQTLKLTLNDGSKLIIENAKEIKTNLSGSLLVLTKDGQKNVKVSNIKKYEIIEK